MQADVLHDAELDAWLRLLLTPYVGSVAAISLLKYFGLPSDVFSQSPDRLKSCPGLQKRQVESLLKQPVNFSEKVENTRVWLRAECDESRTRHVITMADAMYPQFLLHMADPPILLFALGYASALQKIVNNLNRGKAIAVVGSRRATPQGMENAHAFSKSLAMHGLTVVSGLALGVDAAAHTGALDGGKNTTVAVVGTGLDRVYPAKNRDLAHRIVDEGGVIFSEFPLGTPPTAANFPKRNRLLSGMTAGTAVIEAGMKSGSLITARLAAEMGKEVFAVPGSIHSPQSKGCHYLIKQGAKLVESTEDILSELQTVADERLGGTVEEPSGKTAEITGDTVVGESSLLGIMGFEAIHIDTLLESAGMDMNRLQAELLNLELENRVKRLPGGWFQRHVT